MGLSQGSVSNWQPKLSSNWQPKLRILFSNDESSSRFVCSASHSQASFCWRVHGYWTQLHWQHSLQGTSQKWTDLSHHAQLRMRTSRDKMAASGMEFSVLIECEFLAIVSWKVGYVFFPQICTPPIWRLVSQFYSSLGCFYLSGTTGWVVSSNTA